jgi:septum formation protein
MLKLRLVLASESPRRRELLGLLGVPFEIVTSDVDEIPRSGESDLDFVTRAAREKGEDIADQIPDAVVLSADTIVSLDGDILGKPGDADDAWRMLRMLSGRQHNVYTAVSTIHAAKNTRHEGLEETRVWFSDLDSEMIGDYIRREDVLDKAGGYGIQGFASVFIPRIEGNYANVMGLPLPLTYNLLIRHGITCHTSS